MSELSELYQQVISTITRSLETSASSKTRIASADGYNPLCGDQLIYLLEPHGFSDAEDCVRRFRLRDLESAAAC
jgi:hypothetical protein